MSQLAKNLYCVYVRNGAEIWIERERCENLMQELKGIVEGNRFIKFEDQMMNTADIVGIFSAATMADLNRRKNGQWQCLKGTWHGRKDQCECHRNPYPMTVGPLTVQNDQELMEHYQAGRVRPVAEGKWAFVEA
jgi:hypothetical protein